jgi:hypothetical protein
LTVRLKKEIRQGGLLAMDLIPHVEVSLAHPDKDIVKEYRLLEVHPHSFIPICIAHHILRLQFTRIVG